VVTNFRLVQYECTHEFIRICFISGATLLLSFLSFFYPLLCEANKVLSEADGLHFLPFNHLYFVLLENLYIGIDTKQATANFKKALGLATTDANKATIQTQLDGMLEKTINPFQK
jgi:hypothetical protein